MTERLPSSLPQVTPRQREVARLVAEGLTNEQIAEHLDISLAGAKYHVAELLARLHATRREQIAEWYRDGGAEPPRPWFKWHRAAIAIASASLGAAAIAALAIGLPSGGGGNTTILQHLPPLTEQTTIYRTYTRQELLALGMEEIGPFLHADAPIEIEIRAGVTAVRIPAGTEVERWDVVGTHGLQTPRGDEWLWASLLLADWHQMRISPSARTTHQIWMADPHVTHGEFLLVIQEGPWHSDSRVRMVSAVDAEGHLFITPLEWTTPIDSLSGEQLDISRTTALHPLGDLTDWSGTAPITLCEQSHTDQCTARFTGETVSAPISGALACTDRGFTLTNDDITLTFATGYFPDRPALCPEAAPGNVEAGDPLPFRQISPHIQAGTINLGISATHTPTGNPLDTAIGPDATLYIGDIPRHAGCPCTNWN